MPPTADEVKARDEERLLQDPVWSEDFSESEQEFATRLLAQHAPEKIAAAYLRLYAGKQSAPEVLSEYKDGPQRGDRPDRPDRSPKERKEFGPSKWFSIDVGREGKAEARWLLPMICKAGNITKNEIGAIRIQPNETYVEISEPAVAGFLKAVGGDMSLENQAKMTALSGPPQLGERGPRKTKRDYDDKPRGERPARKPRDTSTPPPSAQAEVAAIQPTTGAGDDRRAAKPRHKKSNFAKPERRDHDGAVTPIKKPYKARDDDSRPAYKGKSDGGKPAYKGKGKGDGYKGKSDGYKGKSDGPSGGKPKPKANDTSKRFVPPGGKASPRKGAPKRGGPKR